VKRGLGTAAPAARSLDTSGRGGTPATFEDEALAAVTVLYRTALRLTRMPADAEDLVQETYLKAFRAAHTFEPGTNVRAWLFTILHNTAKNRIRDRARAARWSIQMWSNGTLETPAKPSAAARFRDPRNLVVLKDTLGPELQAAIDALPRGIQGGGVAARRGRVFLREIANMLDIPAGTVMSRISRGRRMLFERLSHLKASQCLICQSIDPARDPLRRRRAHRQRACARRRAPACLRPLSLSGRRRTRRPDVVTARRDELNAVPSTGEQLRASLREPRRPNRRWRLRRSVLGGCHALPLRPRCLSRSHRRRCFLYQLTVESPRVMAAELAADT
jgi:RNA polymerase sigma-70 factor (ECF subfamily)